MSRLAKEASAQEDTHLANQLKLGDEQAFCRLMDKHSGSVYSKTYRTLHNHRDTEEVTMDVFMKVWQKISKWDPKQGSFQAWLNTVAKNTIIDAIRKRERIRESLLLMEEESEVPLAHYRDSAPTPDKVVEEKESKDILILALQQVTKPNHRTAWVLRHLEGCSIAEISGILKRKEGTVKIWIFRCTQELRQIMVRNGFSQLSHLES